MTERRVEWLEWGEAAFRRAQAEDKPVLLSVVVGWDHWCRLMERDTYGDPHVAMLLNRDYVPIRVDADRRPDVNDRYNVGGWPSTVFLTPEGDLLWGAASIEPSQMKQVLVRLREGFAAQRARLAEAIKERDTKVRLAKQGMYTGHALIGEEIIRRTVRGIVRSYDPRSAGFGATPKFPHAASLRVLAQAYFESGGDEFRAIIERSLDAMGWKGLHDAVEGGFHRCCMGEGWSGARTEKLAVDNAAQIRLYLEAGLALDESRYRELAAHTASWALRVLHDPSTGTFGVAQAADDQYFGLNAAGRSTREAPDVDRTFVAEANASLAAAVLGVSAVTGDEALATAGRRSLDAILTQLRDPALGIARTPGVFGILRDQVHVARALVDAYEFFADRRYLEEAVRLLERTWEAHWDEGEQALLDRRPGFEELGELRLRRKNIDESAVACETALRLAAHTGATHWRPRAERVLGGFPDYGEDYGHHTAEYAAALDWLVRPPAVITIVAPLDGGWVSGMRAVAIGTYLPRRVVRWLDPAMDRAALEARGLDPAQSPRAYVSRAEQELVPARTPSELAQRLRQL